MEPGANLLEITMSRRSSLRSDVVELADEPYPTDPAGKKKKKPQRLTSLDAYRGFIMIMLAAHGFGLAALARQPDDSPLWSMVNRESVEAIGFHFDHPPWQSSFVPGTQDATVGSQWMRFAVSFWDLIQPAFMFMVGVAMPFSYSRRASSGESAFKRGFHAFLRAVVLVLMGVVLYSVGHDSTNWIFPNVLAQIGLGYFFVYLILGLPKWGQWASFAAILIGTWGVMQFYQSADYHPEQVAASYERGDVYYPPYRQWSKNGNAFSDFDVWFLNLFPRPADLGPFKYNSGGYQTLNFVPSMATMLLGVFCGQLLLSSMYSPGRKLLYLILGALLAYGLGIVTGAFCCPNVKRIWTPSWVLFSGGYVIGMLALFYLLFDILPLKKLAFPLVVVGMNSILVYIIGETGLHHWIVENTMVHLGGPIQSLLGAIGLRAGLVSGASPGEAGTIMYDAFRPVVNATAGVIVIWLFSLWLYRQKVFLKI